MKFNFCFFLFNLVLLIYSNLTFSYRFNNNNMFIKQVKNSLTSQSSALNKNEIIIASDSYNLDKFIKNDNIFKIHR